MTVPSIREGARAGRPSAGARGGLSSEQARALKAKVGPNEVVEPTLHPVIRFLRHFWSITSLLLEATIVLEAVMGRYSVAYLVLGLLVIGAVLGSYREHKASRAIEALKRRLSTKARVRRDGAWTSIAAREVVPGDLLQLHAGDIVPADARLVTGPIEVDQSTLTGESALVGLEAGGTVLSGTTVRRGECTALVTATGVRTLNGRTVELVSDAESPLHQAEYTASIVKWMILAVGILLAVSAAFAVVEGIDPTEVVSLAVILLISAIPFALPTMFTTSEAFGALLHARRGTVISRLAVVHEAAMMDVLCADKTGTLTINRQGVSRVLPAPGRTESEVLLHAAMASDLADDDPVDIAILAHADRSGVTKAEFTRVSFDPFDPATRMARATVTMEGQRIDDAKDAPRTMVLRAGMTREGLRSLEFKGTAETSMAGADTTGEGQRIQVVKGAAKTVLAMCDGSDPAVGSLASEVDGLSRGGDRVIAVAASRDGVMRPLGLVVMHDILREGSADLVTELGALGVSVKMLTGDSLPVARSVGRAIGLEGSSATMADYRAGRAGRIEDIGVLAEMMPEDKYDVVRALQADGHVVGMVGDGVNDSPVLKQAEVGIAVQDATDVAKGAASAVLTVEGLKGIVELVRVGRETFDRSRTWVLNKVVKTSNTIVLVVLAFLLTRSFIVATLQLVLLLILTDYVTLSIATDRVRASLRPERMAVEGTIRIGVVYGVILVAESVVLLVIGRGILGTGARLQTLMFVWLVLSAYLTALSVRERGHFWASRPSDPLLLSVLIGTVVVMVLSTFGLLGLASMPLWAFGLVLAYAVFACLLVNDAIKVGMRGHASPPDDGASRRAAS